MLSVKHLSFSGFQSGAILVTISSEKLILRDFLIFLYDDMKEIVYTVTFKQFEDSFIACDENRGLRIKNIYNRDFLYLKKFKQKNIKNYMNIFH